MVLDRHANGALPRALWLKAIEDAGFEADSVPLIHSEVPEGKHEVFTGWRRRRAT